MKTTLVPTYELEGDEVFAIIVDKDRKITVLSKPPVSLGTLEDIKNTLNVIAKGGE